MVPSINSSLVLGLLGGVLCLFGFTLYWGGLPLVGMFMGGSIGALIGIIIAYLTRMDSTLALVISVFLAVIGMGIGWRLLRGAHGFLVFVIGACLGYLVVKTILAPYYDGVWSALWMPFASIVVGGLLGFVLFRYVIILVTSAIGAYLIYQAVGQPWVMFVAFFIGLLAQVGLFYRFGLHRKVRTHWS
jgi:hypothetical protein